jgi:TRAP-type mannitol/chloroaromatic compound transport system permease large subunit
MEKGGIGESLVDFVGSFVGRIKGGLGIVMVVSCALFGAIPDLVLPPCPVLVPSCFPECMLPDIPKVIVLP